MDLDELLAAYAAGDLGPDDRAEVETRAAADPAVARRLARLQRLEQLLPSPVEDAGLGPEAVERLDAAVDAALADLPDTPLVAEDRPVPGRRTSAAPARGQDAAVLDLGAARARRRGLPSWAPGVAAAAVAAALAVAVLPDLGGDDTAMDVAAESADDDTEASRDEAATTGPAEQDAPADDGVGGLAEQESDEEAADAPLADATGDDAEVGPARIARFGPQDADEAVAASAELAAALTGDDAGVAELRAEQLAALGDDPDPVLACAGELLAQRDGVVAASITDLDDGGFVLDLVDATGLVTTLGVDARCGLTGGAVS